MARTATGCDPAAPGAGPTARLARPAAMLFDWHGTLVDTLDVMYRSIEHMLQRLPELGLIDRLVAEQACHSEADARLVHYVRIFRRLPPRVLAERRVSRTDIFDALFGGDRQSGLRAPARFTGGKIILQPLSMLNRVQPVLHLHPADRSSPSRGDGWTTTILVPRTHFLGYVGTV